MVVLYPTLHNVFNTDIAKEKSILMKNVFEFCLLLLFLAAVIKTIIIIQHKMVVISKKYIRAVYIIAME
jgi:glucan phosphoethanolaminetransferase (alkaline phosphatase superfamily)